MPPPDRARRNECVSLVHGFLANRLLLGLLASRLRHRGYATETWGYRNMCCSIMVHAERFAAELRRLDTSTAYDRIHLVTHSMGCIIARAALGIYRPAKLGRFVMLAPPNRGSAVATAMESVFGGVFRPVAELTTVETSLVNSLPMPTGIELGVVAAGMDALISWESTRPDVPHDHVTVPCLHSSLLYRRDAADLVAGFLAAGAFPSIEKAAATVTPAARVATANRPAGADM
ncbi:MAG: hypothetical protein EBR86_06880 [Planctomycetia bacterium]|nr:hypothetical protein [Planctomycetia bacterium]